jgi:Flp pilus assembly protein TadG
VFSLAQNKHRLARLGRDTTGGPAVEFALLLPVLLLLVLGALQFGITLNNYIVLTNATDAAARVMAMARGSTTPYSTTTSQVSASASNLTSTNLTVTVRVNGTLCASDSTCQTSLTTNQGKPVIVQASYPCDLTVYGHNYAPGCTLSTQSTELIQ